MKICFVFKVGQNMGLGHAVRTNYISEYMQKNYKAKNFFFCYGDINMAKKIGIKSFLFNQDLFFLKIDEIKPDFVVFDMQKVNKEILKKLRKKNIKTVVIEDGSIKPEEADLIWDSNKNNYQKKISHYITGIENSLINPDILKYKKNNFSHEVKKILICLGGTDINNNVPFLINRLSNKFKLYIMAGMKYEKYLNSKNKNVKILFDKKKLWEHASCCDIAVVSGGITMFETTSLNIPVIVWPQVDHQNETASVMEQKGLVFNIGVVGKKAGVINQIFSFTENLNIRKKLFFQMKKLKLGVAVKKFGKILEELYG
ncbi:MAG: hypothetical protein ACQESP_08465 [Candidatus Muiribacteriota bacterium]